MDNSPSFRQAFWRLLKPAPEEFAFMVFVIIFVFAVGAYQLSTGGSIGTEAQQAATSISGLFRQAISSFDGATAAAKILLFGFWFLIGTVLYFIVWFGISLLIDIYNDIVISAAFMHPRSFHQSQYWAAIAGRSIVRVLAGTALVVFGLLSLRLLGSGYVGAAKSLMQQPHASTVLAFIFSTLLAAIAVHILVILYKIAFLKIR